MGTKNGKARTTRRQPPPRMALSEYILVEWSETHKQFHYETLGRSIQKNRFFYLSKQNSDWIPVAIVPTWDHADEAYRELELQRRFREEEFLIH